MGCHVFTVLTALLLFTEYDVSAQYASVVECIPATTVTARPIIQTGGQYIQPTIIKPIVPSYDSYAPELPYPRYGNYPAPVPPFPPIIIEDKSDIWHHVLYYLIFALQNQKANNIINSQCRCNSCNCCGSCNCGCCCNNNNNYNNNNNNDDNDDSAPTYIPVPIAIPVLTGPDGFSLLDALAGFGDDIIIQGAPGQAGGGKEPNEINLIIRADC